MRERPKKGIKPFCTIPYARTLILYVPDFIPVQFYREDSFRYKLSYVYKAFVATSIIIIRLMWSLIELVQYKQQ